MRRALVVSLCLLLAAVLAVSVLSGCGPGGQYVASTSSNRFHTLSCPWAAQIRDESKLTFKTRDEAIAAGKTPCPTCNP